MILALLAVAAGLHAEGSKIPPEYHAEGPVSGLIRAWGSSEMAGVMLCWQRGFTERQREVRFDDHLYGTASSIAGIYTGVSDLSLLGREIWPIESMAFESVFPYKPTGIQVATGSYDIPKATYALVVFVNKANPLTKLNLEQVAAMFGVPRVAGAKAIRTWGEVGLTGEWSRSPIHTYNFEYDNDKAIFFRRRVFASRYAWRDETREFSNTVRPAGGPVDSGELILQALAKDRFGIAVSNARYANDQVKALALADDGHEYVNATKETVQNRTYPLTRSVYIYINRSPDRRCDPRTLEFLRYVLSREGQNDVTVNGTYLALPGEIAAAQLKKLE